MDLYRDARRHVRRRLDIKVSGQKRVAIYGIGEAAELAFLLLKELNLDVVGVFDERAGVQFLGLDVRDIADHNQIAYDVMVVAVLDNAHRTLRKLSRAGVAPEKLLLLREMSSGLPATDNERAAL